jgi:hypothetical protein
MDAEGGRRCWAESLALARLRTSPRSCPESSSRLPAVRGTAITSGARKASGRIERQWAA